MPKKTITSKILRPFVYAVLFPMACISAYLVFVETPIYESTSILELKTPEAANSASLLGQFNNISENSEQLKAMIASTASFEKMNRPYPINSIYYQADFMNKFGGVLSYWENDDLAAYHYYKSHVYVEVDKNSGFAVLHVKAYDPKTAQNMAWIAIHNAEKDLNALDVQAHKKAEQRQHTIETNLLSALKSDQESINKIREETHLYDPDIFYKSILDEKTQLEMKKLEQQSQYQSLLKTTPNNPMSIAYRAQMNVYDDALHSLDVMPKDANDYDFLTNKRKADFATLQEVQSTLYKAQMTNPDDQYRIRIYSEPSHLASPTYPAIFWDLAISFAVLLIIWLFFF